jgi:hypothetical protein
MLKEYGAAIKNMQEEYEATIKSMQEVYEAIKSMSRK